MVRGLPGQAQGRGEGPPEQRGQPPPQPPEPFEHRGPGSVGASQRGQKSRFFYTSPPTSLPLIARIFLARRTDQTGRCPRTGKRGCRWEWRSMLALPACRALAHRTPPRPSPHQGHGLSACPSQPSLHQLPSVARVEQPRTSCPKPSLRPGAHAPSGWGPPCAWTRLCPRHISQRAKCVRLRPLCRS